MSAWWDTFFSQEVVNNEKSKNAKNAAAREIGPNVVKRDKEVFTGFVNRKQLRARRSPLPSRPFP